MLRVLTPTTSGSPEELRSLWIPDELLEAFPSGLRLGLLGELELSLGHRLGRLRVIGGLPVSSGHLVSDGSRSKSGKANFSGISEMGLESSRWHPELERTVGCRAAASGAAIRWRWWSRSSWGVGDDWNGSGSFGSSRSFGKFWKELILAGTKFGREGGRQSSSPVRVPAC